MTLEIVLAFHGQVLNEERGWESKKIQSKNNGSAITQTRWEVTVRYPTGSHKQKGISEITNRLDLNYIVRL